MEPNDLAWRCEVLVSLETREKLKIFLKWQKPQKNTHARITKMGPNCVNKFWKHRTSNKLFEGELNEITRYIGSL
jgi:hypothetical protein